MTSPVPKLAATAATEAEAVKIALPKHALSAIPTGGPIVRTAAMLVIGDEVLNGKTKDSNSAFLARMLFEVGIELKRIEVIADDEAEIVEALRRMSKNYDLVITSGGIGPTHDDITYSSVAAAFNTELVYDDETIKRMMSMNTRARGEQTEAQKTARLRMALFPKGAEVLFVHEELWVPVVAISKVHIFPGVPTLFERLITGFISRFVPLPPASEKPFRMLVHTALPESSIAPFLTELSKRVASESITVGSYPKFGVGVDVSLIGKDEKRLLELVDEVAKELEGTLVLSGKMGEEGAIAAKI